MALHPVKLPKSAVHLFRIVILQKRLLQSLADPGLDTNLVNTAWVQGVWSMLDPEWVRKFCLGGQEVRIQTIARESPDVRKALFDEFCQQNRVKMMLDTGENFNKIINLPNFTDNITNTVKEFFKQCYKLLSHNESRKWKGYDFACKGSITNRSYKEDFCSTYPTSVVCPYCDGEIGTPQLDHYYSKTDFPLLACSPWNLIPVCSSCNDIITAKGDRPALSLGTPRSTDNWLHPFFRTATSRARITLSGSLPNSIPKLTSPDPLEQIRLNNHSDLIQTLEIRWTHKAAAYHDVLVSRIKGIMILRPQKRLDEFVQDRLDDHIASHGKQASSMIHAAVCRAILDQRPEYIEEFSDSNAPVLD